jgi:hypothetical protein
MELGIMLFERAYTRPPAGHRSRPFDTPRRPAPVIERRPVKFVVRPRCCFHAALPGSSSDVIVPMCQGTLPISALWADVKTRPALVRREAFGEPHQN